MSPPSLAARELVFLPGAGADPEFWRPVGDLLPNTWGKTYLGWPGIGHQAPHPDVQSFHDLVLLTERALPPGRVDLLAQSFGGAIALAVILRNPARIRRLVLSVTAAGMDIERLGAIDWRPGYRAEYPNAGSWLYNARPDFSADLASVSQPTLLLWGDSDPISPVKVGQTFEQAMPRAKLHVVPGGHHALVNEDPSAVAALIQAHLSL